MSGDPPRGRPTVDVALTREPLDVARAQAAVTHPTCGGIGVFAGVVRDHHQGEAVAHLDYEAWEEEAVRAMRAVADTVLTDHPAVRAVHISHRVGRLEIGDVSVVCAASAPHRAQALAATQALIDRVKAGVPIWKRETRPDGSTTWIEGDTQP